MVGIPEDCCGDQLAAQKKEATPTALEREAGWLIFCLPRADCFYVAKFAGGAAPFCSMNDWDHNCRTLRRNLLNSDVVFFMAVGGGWTCASFAFVKLFRDAAGERAGFLHDAADYNRSTLPPPPPMALAARHHCPPPAACRLPPAAYRPPPATTHHPPLTTHPPILPPP